MPDHAAGVGSQPAHRHGEAAASSSGRLRPSAGAARVGVAVAREVDGDERPVEGEGDGVPRVGVLRPAVDEDQLGFGRPPHQRADPAAVGAARPPRAAPWAARRTGCRLGALSAK